MIKLSAPILLSLFSCITLHVAAQYPNARPQSQYAAPPANSYLPQSGGYQSPPSPQSAYGAPQTTTTTEAPRDLKVFRHVFVHSAPNDGPQESQIRRIRGPGGDEKHVNIIFVKAPAPAAPDQQVVDVPNDGGRKTLVYVLLKKAEDSPDVKFNAPPPTKPSKPEVYFIRYKDQTTTTQAPPADAYGVPAGDPVAPVANSLSGYA